MTRGKNRRAYVRYPMPGSVAISWQDGQGSFQVLQARGVDISESGAQIESISPIQLGNTVMLRSERCNLSAAASVRYCRARGSSFRMGLEFIGGQRWHFPD